MGTGMNRCWSPNTGRSGDNDAGILAILRAIESLLSENGAVGVERTFQPTLELTRERTLQPTLELTRERTLQPTLELTRERTLQPTLELTRERTLQPTLELTRERTFQPTLELTRERTLEGTFAPTFAPTLALVFAPGGVAGGAALGADGIGAAVSNLANVAGTVAGFANGDTENGPLAGLRAAVPDDLIPNFMALFNKVRAFADGEAGEEGVNTDIVNEFLRLLEVSAKK